MLFRSNGLLSTLPIVQATLDAVPVPGRKAAVGGLLQVLRGLDVREDFVPLSSWVLILWCL